MFAVRVPFRRLALLGLVLTSAAMPSHARRRDLVLVKFPVPLHRHAGRPATAIRVVDGATAKVLAAARGTHLQVRRITPFVGFAVGSWFDGAGGDAPVSPIFRHDTGRVDRVTAAAVASGSGGYVGMGDIPFSLPDGQTANAAGTVLGPLFRQTQDEGVGYIDETSKFREARQREIDLQEQGVTDPSTHIADTPITPDLHVDGNLAETDGRVTGEIRLTDDGTGEVIRIPIDEPIGDGDDWPDVVRRIVERVRPKLLERLRRRPSTSTSSTTTPAASTTSTSSATVTLPTTTSGTGTSTTIGTTTTAPATTTTTLQCTSSAQCGPTACCNAVHRCCDIAHPDNDACAAGIFADRFYSCSYVSADIPPSEMNGECGPQSPPLCPNLYPKTFNCTQCTDTGKYIQYASPP